MEVTLSGGDLGGTVVTDWPEGQEEVTIDGFVYRKVSETQAVLVGPAT